MKKVLFRLPALSILLLFLLVSMGQAQAKDENVEHLYLILFKNKNLSYVNKLKPESYLTQKALDRREKYGIEVDSLDWPVSKTYIESIRTKGLKILYPTRWMNGIVVSTDEHDKARSCLMLFYVDKCYYLGKKRKSTSQGGIGTKSVGDLNETQVADGQMQDELEEQYASGYEQINMLNGVDLHQNGYTGKGISIAVFDAGFYNVDKNPVFENAGDQIVYTWDFVEMERDVFNDDSHGAHVLTCMAASKRKTLIGSAPDASYYLFRTESAKYEYLYEEIHWIRAAEVADSLGIDVINSSLGYTYFDDQDMDHNWNDLGGNTWISKGASIAASRGILVVNAAGNEGNGKWKYVNPPADMPDVLAVGAVQMNGNHVNFSSYGHPSLLTVKPDICAPGYGVSTATSTGKIAHGNGTSYASPIVCGLAACLLQAYPNASPHEIIAAIINSADRRLTPDTAYGHGVPDFLIASAMLGKSTSNGFVAINKESSISSDNKSLLYAENGERYEAVFYNPGKFLFFHTMKNKVKVEGLILETGYAVVKVPEEFSASKIVGVKCKAEGDKGKVKVKQVITR